VWVSCSMIIVFEWRKKRRAVVRVNQSWGEEERRLSEFLPVLFVSLRQCDCAHDDEKLHRGHISWLMERQSWVGWVWEWTWLLFAGEWWVVEWDQQHIGWLRLCKRENAMRMAERGSWVERTRFL
jgi:hypothetical protein